MKRLPTKDTGLDGYAGAKVKAEDLKLLKAHSVNVSKVIRDAIKEAAEKVKKVG